MAEKVAVDFIWLLSPTYRSKVAENSEIQRRRAVIVRYLDPKTYGLPNSLVTQVISELSKIGINAAHGTVRKDGEFYRIPYRYLCGDAAEREMIERHLENKKRAELIGLQCLLNDGISTWEQVISSKEVTDYLAAQIASEVEAKVEAAFEDFMPGGIVPAMIMDEGQLVTGKTCPDEWPQVGSRDNQAQSGLAALGNDGSELSQLAQEVNDLTAGGIMSSMTNALDQACSMYAAKLERVFGEKDSQLESLGAEISILRAINEDLEQERQRLEESLKETATNAQRLTEEKDLVIQKLTDERDQLAYDLEKRKGQCQKYHSEVDELKDKIRLLEASGSRQTLEQIQKMLSAALAGRVEFVGGNSLGEAQEAKQRRLKTDASNGAVLLPNWSVHYNLPVEYHPVFVAFFQDRLGSRKRQRLLGQKIDLIISAGKEKVSFKSIEMSTEATPAGAHYTRVLEKNRLTFDTLPDRVVFYEIIPRDQLIRATSR